MNKSKTALIVGATGLVGYELLRMLATEGGYSRVIALVRRPLGYSHPSLTVHVVDFNQLSQYQHLVKADDAFCCLGTTMKQAGSKEAFYKVDFTYVTEVAQAAARNGTKRFFLVTAMGANAGSSVYYNRVKGEVENAVKKLPFESVAIFRPSLLLGERRESRIGESIGKVLSQLFSFLIPARYKAIEGRQVARAMLLTAQGETSGVRVLESDELRQM